ncbi:MAG TPA: hypothetical protein VGF45_12815 [Polyangia bacterium]
MIRVAAAAGAVSAAGDETEASIVGGVVSPGVVPAGPAVTEVPGAAAPAAVVIPLPEVPPKGRAALAPPPPAFPAVGDSALACVFDALQPPPTTDDPHTTAATTAHRQSMSQS